jgi:hypothetical protein
MASPRVTSRPPAPSRGGGGTGTGGTPGTGGTAAGYDRYIGTLGLATDAPANAGFPHHTDFPTTPQKYDWVRVVSTLTTASGIAIEKQQEWVCSVAAVGTTPASWVLRFSQPIKDHFIGTLGVKDDTSIASTDTNLPFFEDFPAYPEVGSILRVVSNFTPKYGGFSAVKKNQEWICVLPENDDYYATWILRRLGDEYIKPLETVSISVGSLFKTPVSISSDDIITFLPFDTVNYFGDIPNPVFSVPTYFLDVSETIHRLRYPSSVLWNIILKATFENDITGDRVGTVFFATYEKTGTNKYGKRIKSLTADEKSQPASKLGNSTIDVIRLNFGTDILKSPSNVSTDYSYVFYVGLHQNSGVPLKALFSELTISSLGTVGRS